MKKIVLTLLVTVALGLLAAGAAEEAAALKGWLDQPFSAAALEAEREAKLAAQKNPVKGEFETTAQFEQRKRDSARVQAEIKAEYEEKIRDARAAYEANTQRLRQRLQVILGQSREIVELSSTPGTYDPDLQKLPVNTSEKKFEIVVPLSLAEGVKKNYSQYKLKVTRQLDDDLRWAYLEARLEGPAGQFSSTDKAPAPGKVSVSGGIIPPDLVTSQSYSEPSGNNYLDAEETAQVLITVRNKGKGDAYAVTANLELFRAAGVSCDPSLYFGQIAPGGESSKTLKLRAGSTVEDGQAELKITFSEQNGFPPDPLVLKFDTRALRPPDIYIADLGIDDFNQNLKIEPAEPVEITLRVHNKGSGPARAVVADVLRGEGVYPSAGNSRSSFDLGDIESGDYKDFTFGIVTAKTATALDIRIDLKESRPQFSKLAQPLNLALNKIEQTTQQLVVKGRESGGRIAQAPNLSSDVDRDIPVLAKPDRNRWGVIIGIENYQKVNAPVPFARRDALIMKDYFINILGIPEENIYTKTNNDASKTEFSTIFGPRLAKNASGKDNEVFVYYSGHGVPDNRGREAYLLPYDGIPEYPETSGYGLQTLYTDLGKLNAKHVTIFLDSCFSGRNRDNQSILTGAKALVITPELPSVAPGMTVFSAAGGQQMANVYEDQQHGLFTYYLMKGLRGEADADNDKNITQQELNNYLRQNVTSISRRLDREQEPQLMSSDPKRVIVKLK